MIGLAIYSILKNDSEVSTLVSERIYPINAREGDSVPYITYQIISNVPANTKQTAALIDRYRVQVSSFATNHMDALNLAKKVRIALDNHALATYYTTEFDDDYEIKISSIDFDGEIELGLTNANVFEIAQDYEVTAYITDRVYSDWFLPSKDELQAMRTNLYAEGVGDFNNEYYWSSSEYDATNGQALFFETDTASNESKGGANFVRACRSFSAVSGAYSLRDIGPAGGLIFNIDDTDPENIVYYEAAPSNQTDSIWSNVNTSIGTTSTDIGEGQNNTDEIIAQDGHTDSAAKLCDDVEI